jgi:hypothetical protein
MDKIAETTRAKFERHSIATVLDMKMISAATISAIKEYKGFRVSEQALKKCTASAEKAHEGSVPLRVRMDHILTCRDMGVTIGWMKFVNALRCRGLYA